MRASFDSMSRTESKYEVPVCVLCPYMHAVRKIIGVYNNKSPLLPNI